MIALTAIAVYGTENLAKLQLKVDEEVNLLKDLTYAEGITLQKVEIVQDGVRTVIDNPESYTPEYPGSIELVLTLSRPDGSTLEVEVNNLTIKALKYQAIPRERIKAEEVFPQLTQIEAGDKNIYEYVKDL